MGSTDDSPVRRGGSKKKKNKGGAVKSCEPLSDASLVSPFTSSDPSLMSVDRLLREARCALATSFASYKFMVGFGLLDTIIRFFKYILGVRMPQMPGIVNDSILTVWAAWGLAHSLPRNKMSAKRPTEALFGHQILCSLIGVSIISLTFHLTAFRMLFTAPFFKCRSFDSTGIPLSDWVKMADNYESETLYLVEFAQVTAFAFVLNFGYQFRQSWWKNWRLNLMVVTALSYLSFLTLADPNPISCIFRVNCDTAHDYWNNYEPFRNAYGTNEYPVYFRRRLRCLFALNFVAMALYEWAVLKYSKRVLNCCIRKPVRHRIPL
eukprot:38550_1